METCRECTGPLALGRDYWFCIKCGWQRLVTPADRRRIMAHVLSKRKAA